MGWEEIISQLEQLFRDAGGTRKVKFIRMGAGAYRRYCEAAAQRHGWRQGKKVDGSMRPHFRGLRIYMDDRLEAEQVEMCGEPAADGGA